MITDHSKHWMDKFQYYITQELVYKKTCELLFYQDKHEFFLKHDVGIQRALFIVYQNQAEVFLTRKPAWRNGYRFWLLIKGFRVRIPAWVSVAALAHLGERQTEVFQKPEIWRYCVRATEAAIFFFANLSIKVEEER